MQQTTSLLASEHSTVIAGFGGQGVLLAGLVLSQAGMNAGLNVAWIPSYGPEMRGGTANCTVIVSPEEIGSPIVSRPCAAVAMNEPSMAKYGPRVLSGGVLVVNSSLARSPFERPDLRILKIPAGDLAAELGDDRMANMVALGALVRATGVLPPELVEAAIAEALGPDKEQFVEPNREAFRRGVELAAR